MEIHTADPHTDGISPDIGMTTVDGRRCVKDSQSMSEGPNCKRSPLDGALWISQTSLKHFRTYECTSKFQSWTLGSEDLEIYSELFQIFDHTLQYIVWGLAMETLENSLLFSLARCELLLFCCILVIDFGFLLQVSDLMSWSWGCLYTNGSCQVWSSTLELQSGLVHLNIVQTCLCVIMGICEVHKAPSSGPLTIGPSSRETIIYLALFIIDKNKLYLP